MSAPVTFKRVWIGRPAPGAPDDRESVQAWHLHDSSWAIIRYPQLDGSGPWAVVHVGTGLRVYAGIATLAAAKDLAVTLRNAHPSLPALDSQPFGVPPNQADHPAAKAEALAIFATLQAWRRAQESRA